tara:strand:+ start:47841 stop:48560 length:720 start_codon:yes stop_codon:yes gene_type:complete
MNNIICFLTLRPCELFYNFVKNLPNSENIYICIDDNNHEIPNYDGKIKVIKYENKVAEEKGYKSTYLWKNNESISRDKALYHFCVNDIKFEYIWFIEEDVFIPTVNTIIDIDNKYLEGDLLVSKHDVFNVDIEDLEDWHWLHLRKQIKLPKPYAKSMICAIRCSKKLLDSIKNYVNMYNNLFLDECLFNTIAMQNGLSIKIIPELKTITWNTEWSKNTIKKQNLYHPIKSIKEQYEYRK